MNKNDLKLRIGTVFNNFINAIQQRADINKKRGWWVVDRSDWQPYSKRARSEFRFCKKSGRPYDKKCQCDQGAVSGFWQEVLHRTS